MDVILDRISAVRVTSFTNLYLLLLPSSLHWLLCSVVGRDDSIRPWLFFASHPSLQIPIAVRIGTPVQKGPIQIDSRQPDSGCTFYSKPYPRSTPRVLLSIACPEPQELGRTPMKASKFDRGGNRTTTRTAEKYQFRQFPHTAVPSLSR